VVVTTPDSAEETLAAIRAQLEQAMATAHLVELLKPLQNLPDDLLLDEPPGQGVLIPLHDWTKLVEAIEPQE
jgi:hypothetical protein